MSENGKGDVPRPLSVPKEIYDDNFERIFGTVKKPKIKGDDALDRIDCLNAHVSHQLRNPRLSDRLFRWLWKTIDG